MCVYNRDCCQCMSVFIVVSGYLHLNACCVSYINLNHFMTFYFQNNLYSRMFLVRFKYGITAWTDFKVKAECGPSGSTVNIEGPQFSADKDT